MHPITRRHAVASGSCENSEISREQPAAGDHRYDQEARFALQDHQETATILQRAGALT